MSPLLDLSPLQGVEDPVELPLDLAQPALQLAKRSEVSRPLCLRHGSALEGSVVNRSPSPSSVVSFILRGPRRIGRRLRLGGILVVRSPQPGGNDEPIAGLELIVRARVVSHHDLIDIDGKAL